MKRREIQLKILFLFCFGTDRINSKWIRKKTKFLFVQKVSVSTVTSSMSSSWKLHIERVPIIILFLRVRSFLVNFQNSEYQHFSTVVIIRFLTVASWASFKARKFWKQPFRLKTRAVREQHENSMFSSKLKRNKTKTSC